MVLSGAAGGVGSMVSQMAANVVGCDVVGIAGGPEKCHFILDHGCRAAIDYKADDIPARLDALCPDGIDLYFDNVGGETLEACLERLHMFVLPVCVMTIIAYSHQFLAPTFERTWGWPAEKFAFINALPPRRFAYADRAPRRETRHHPRGA